MVYKLYLISYFKVNEYSFLMCKLGVKIYVEKIVNKKFIFIIKEKYLLISIG